MVISRKKQPTLPTSPIVINNSPLTRVESYKYLGVWITCRLSWSLQVEEVCKKARRHIGVLYRKFYQHASNQTFLRLYLTYIRPHLEYAAAVWDPYQQGLINSLESVQRFALKASTRNWTASYDTLINICLWKNIGTVWSCPFYIKYSTVTSQSLLLLLKEEHCKEIWGTLPHSCYKGQLCTQMHISIPFSHMPSHCGTNSL